jgi:Saxitoxin biosynthesis operon protein SxtJ
MAVTVSDVMIEPARRMHDIEMASERKFGLVFAALFAAIGLWPGMEGQPPRLWAIAIAFGFAALASIRPAALRTPNAIWFRLGLALGAVMNPVVMALLYVTTFLPTGLFLRLRKVDLLQLQRDPERSSYWTVCEAPSHGDMARQF